MTEKIKIHNNPRQRKPKSKTKHDRENQVPKQFMTEQILAGLLIWIKMIQKMVVTADDDFIALLYVDIFVGHHRITKYY